MATLAPRSRAAAAMLLIVAAVSLSPGTGSADAASFTSVAGGSGNEPSVMAYRGLGTWVDIYDDQAWDDPEGTVLAIAARGVHTLYLETCNFSCKNALFRPHRMARILTAAHALDMRVVAWYLPGFDKPVRDYNRSMRAIEFETPTGDRFDAFALDIEAKVVTSVSTRNARVLDLAEDLRAAVGPSYPLGAITPPWYWDWPFPYAGLAEHVDVFLPMAYSSFRVSGARATHTDIVRNIEAVRQGTGRRNIPIHLIGGIADGLNKGETRAVVRAAREHGLFGISLYDYFTSSAEDWTQLAAWNVRFE